jgi:MFS family permease
MTEVALEKIRTEQYASDPVATRGPSAYACLVLALTFGLLLSDYMSRQVLSAVFPLLKVDWQLSDSQLGTLGGVVPLAVGILTLPLSMLADRIGRVRSIAAMAILWSLGTLACGLSAHFGQMLIARAMVGVGEAAYGSVGVAVVVAVFPKAMRATIVAMFAAGGVFGSALGVALGGAIAAQTGWRWSFAAMGVIGLVLGAIYPLMVQEMRTQVSRAESRSSWRPSLTSAAFQRVIATLFPSRAVALTYVGSGLQLFVAAALIAWMPSFLNRYYAMGSARAAAIASGLILVGGFGTIGCGILADWVSRRAPRRQLLIACVYCLASAALVAAALLIRVGWGQIVLLGLAMSVASGSFGPAGSAAAAGSNLAAHASVFATLTLINNFLGLAPGPFLTGLAADRWGLWRALQLAPIAAVAAAAAFAAAYVAWTDRGVEAQPSDRQ